MILIVDSGSTKTDWTLLNDNKIVERFVTNGFNPNFCDMNLISSFTSIITSYNIDIENIANVYFYGSGCGNDDNIFKMKEALSCIFKNSVIEVFSDILGSCHSILGNEIGIACILGTGSNACLYNGKSIEKNAISLGYLLGDEGSGCHIGKIIVHDYFYGTMPCDLGTKFSVEYNLDRNTLISKVYRESQPSKFLASFSKFAYQNIENQYVIEVVSKCFNEFIEYCILPLTKGNGKFGSVGFVGSVAFYFQDILRGCLGKHGLCCNRIVKSPMDGLIKFYS